MKTASEAKTSALLKPSDSPTSHVVVTFYLLFLQWAAIFFKNLPLRMNGLYGYEYACRELHLTIRKEYNLYSS